MPLGNPNKKLVLRAFLSYGLEDFQRAMKGNNK
jgi:hypothetical protein